MSTIKESIYRAEQLSVLPFLTRIDELRWEADSFKPLHRDTEDRILQKFRLDWNYHSNAIEGNKLTYGETVAFIMEGLTANGKPLKDHLDIQGHDEAVKYLIYIIREKDYSLTEADIRNLHKMVLQKPYLNKAQTPEGLSTTKEVKIGEYKSSPNHVLTPTGEIHYYATPEDTPILMGELMDFYKMAKENNKVHPLILATLFHHEFTAIHPFDDGNGRMTRLLMNLILMQAGYPPIVVKQDDRHGYYQVLRKADAGEFIPVVEYMNKLLQHSLEIYIKGARGESIEEESDIDKEIALFKKGLGEDRIKFSKTEELVEKALKESVMPLFKALVLQFSKIEDLFINVEKKIEFGDTIRPEQYFISTIEAAEIDDIFMNEEGRFLHDIIGTDQPRKGDYNLTQFMFAIFFNGYRKSKISMSETRKYKILLSDYEYHVYREVPNYEGLLRKAYGENVTKSEIDLISKKEVRSLMETLKQYS